VKIAVDTNVLVRLVVGDDEMQQAKAAEILDAADLVAVSVHTLCEFAWVLLSCYKVAKNDVAKAIRGILDMKNVVVNLPAVEAGLAILDAGGDFADGVIAFDGRWLGGETFVSFDKKAVALLEANGTDARSLA
jgi:predicted nucleic-acid-binding protein